jgi:hypothetical protein
VIVQEKERQRLAEKARKDKEREEEKERSRSTPEAKAATQAALESLRETVRKIKEEENAKRSQKPMEFTNGRSWSEIEADLPEW